MNTLYLNQSIEGAADIILDGGLVAVPTETVYGLAANGLNAEAVQKIYDVKGRPEIKPISLLVSGIDSIKTFCIDIPEAAYKLADAFWPGPLTMILKKSPLVPDIVTAGGSTVGVRCPAHPLTLALIQETGLPLATPSANPSGQPSPKSCELVKEYFDGKIDCIIDGGACSVGIESTIVDLSGEEIKILRHGGLSDSQIFEIVG